MGNQFHTLHIIAAFSHSKKHLSNASIRIKVRSTNINIVEYTNQFNDIVDVL